MVIVDLEEAQYTEEVYKLGLDLIESWEEAARKTQERRAARMRRMPEIRDIAD